MNRVFTIAGAVAAATVFPLALAGCGDDGENRESRAPVADVAVRPLRRDRLVGRAAFRQ
jgi:hypothetical protein